VRRRHPGIVEMTSKVCTKCGVDKPMDKFHKMTASGYLRSRCKPCNNADIRASRGNDEYREAWQRYVKKAREYPAARARDRRHAEQYRASYPEKTIAKQELRWALDAGRITRPNVCEQCGIIDPKRTDGRTLIHGHHDDYSKPLDVRWLCCKCHNAHHRALLK
jgi:hypothetical protein